jgi:arylsulfatase A-like enzyme
MCIKWPGVVKPNSETDVPVNGIDFMPTFAEIASAALPKNQPVDGKSILPVLTGKPFDRERPLFFHFPLYLGGRKDAVLPSFTGEKNYWRAVPSTTIISGDWKLIYYYEYERYELFNLKDDISEQYDLAATKTGVALRLLENLKTWTEKVNAPVPVELNEQ